MLKEDLAEFVTVLRCLRELNIHSTYTVNLLDFKNCFRNLEFQDGYL